MATTPLLKLRSVILFREGKSAPALQIEAKRGRETGNLLVRSLKMTKIDRLRLIEINDPDK